MKGLWDLSAITEKFKLDPVGTNLCFYCMKYLLCYCSVHCLQTEGSSVNSRYLSLSTATHWQCFVCLQLQIETETVSIGEVEEED